MLDVEKLLEIADTLEGDGYNPSVVATLRGAAEEAREMHAVLCELVGEASEPLSLDLGYDWDYSASAQ